MQEGLSPSFFWSLTIGEVKDVLLGRQKKQEQDLKLKITIMSVQAQQIAECIAKTKDIKNEIRLRNLWDYYPSLFVQEKKISEIQQSEQDFEEYKVRRLEFARAHNEKFGGEY